MIAMRPQMTQAPQQTAAAYALPDAPLSMPMQVIEHQEGWFQRLVSSLRTGVPAQGN